jgi:hypothetical protein
MCTRRDVLKVGALGLAGLTLRDVLAFGQDARAKSCILVWLNGGPSHLDMFDLKPEAPIEIRGDFRPAKSIDGVYVSEHLPKIAALMKRLALLRSVTSPEGNHDRATHYLLTGHRPSPAVAYPSLGSVVAKEIGLGRDVPSNVAIPHTPEYLAAGYLPAAYNAFEASPGGVRDLSPTVSLERIARRRDMLKVVDDLSRAVEETPATQSRDQFFEQAYRLVASDKAKAAFDLSKEPQAMRDAYGHHELGRACLLARRLVEAGARFVTVNDNGWDTHQNIFRALRDGFPGKLPGLDQAFSALMNDLESRGLLKETLVVLMGEFGRTPKLNSGGGRDHWPRVNSVVLAGGGVRPAVVGTSDAHGELPDQRPVPVEDLVFTIYSLLGIDARKKYIAPGGRPLPILQDGELIREIV